MQDTNMQQSDMQGTNLQQSDMQGTNLQQSDMQGTNLQQRNTRDAGVHHGASVSAAIPIGENRMDTPPTSPSASVTPVVMLLEASDSLSEDERASVNDVVRKMFGQLAAETDRFPGCELLVVPFGTKARIQGRLQPLAELPPPAVTALPGPAQQGKAVLAALDALHKRREGLRVTGTPCATPCLLLVTTARGEDDLADAARYLEMLQESDALRLFTVGVGAVDQTRLRLLSARREVHALAAQDDFPLGLMRSQMPGATALNGSEPNTGELDESSHQAETISLKQAEGEEAVPHTAPSGAPPSAAPMSEILTEVSPSFLSLGEPPASRRDTRVPRRTDRLDRSGGEVDAQRAKAAAEHRAHAESLFVLPSERRMENSGEAEAAQPATQSAAPVAEQNAFADALPTASAYLGGIPVYPVMELLKQSLRR